MVRVVEFTISIKAMVDVGEFRFGDHPVHVLVCLQVQDVDDAVHVQLGVHLAGGVGDINVGPKGKNAHIKASEHTRGKQALQHHTDSCIHIDM